MIGDNYLASLEIGTILATFLMGILTMQTFSYCRNFVSDSRVLKTAIAAIWFLEVVHTMCLVYMIYVSTVLSTEQSISFPYSRVPAAGVIFCTGTIDVLVQASIQSHFKPTSESISQIFLGHQLRAVSGRPYLFFLFLVLALLRFAYNIVIIYGIALGSKTCSSVSQLSTTESTLITGYIQSQP
ncbi:hypothetical protein MVEN_02316000 [Mycena venus]|uniref:Uncharacterized protein n=1 Tax=Mycena venus TaxID=2733690 RepID=A0A8H6X4P4_9AGAR|nr:hypothetical protein MVEN_02316000 [Mycena venus]